MMTEQIKGIILLDNIKMYLELGETGYDILKRLNEKKLDTTTMAYLTGIPIYILDSKLSKLNKKKLIEYKKIEKLGEKVYKLTKKGKKTLAHLRAAYI